MKFILMSLVTVTFVVGCQSIGKDPSQLSQFNDDMNFEEFRNQWLSLVVSHQEKHPRQSASETNRLERFFALCESDPSLCESHQRKSSGSKKYSKKRAQEFFEHVSSQRWEEVANFGSAFALDAFRRKKFDQLLQMMPSFLAADCEATESRHALAAIIEDHLPKTEALRASIDLYEKNAICSNKKVAIHSAYRGGMLRILEDRCDAAVPLLKQVMNSTEDHLKSRSLYWSWNCLGKSTSYLESMKKSVPYFSYHGLVMNSDSSHTFIEGRELADSTPFLLNSKDHGLNQVRNLVREALLEGENLTARAILQKVSMDRIQSSEPAYRTQWAYYMHLAQVGVPKFQILAKLINDRPEFRTKSVKSMLFPNWYFESVSFHSSHVDPWLIQSLIRQESAFNPHARSRVGATGLMQLMPSTARLFGKINRTQLKDPEQNVKIGIRFFEKLLNRYDGDVHHALAAYNAGPGKVDEWIKKYPTNDPLLFADVIPYRETREYVAFILRNYYWYQYLSGQAKLTSPLLSLGRTELMDVE